MTFSWLRVIAGASIPTSDYRELLPGVFVVKPTRLASVRAFLGNQPWYVRWLDRGYAAREVPLNHRGDVCWVLGRPSGRVVLGAARPGVSDWTPSTAHYCAQPDFYNGVLSGWQGGVALEGAIGSSGTSAVRVGQLWNVLYTAGGELAGTPTPTGTVVADATANSNWGGLRRRFNGVPIGPRKSGFVGGGGQGSTTDTYRFYGGTYSNSQPFGWTVEPGDEVPAMGDEWALLSGPMLLTRGEIYSTSCYWFAASSAEAALMMRQGADGAKDANDAARLEREALAAEARAGDLFVLGKFPAATNIWSLIPSMAGNAADLAALTETLEGMNFATVNSVTSSGAEFSSVVADAMPLSEFAAIFTSRAPSVVVDVDTGLWESADASGTVANLRSHVLALRRVGVTPSVTTTGGADLSIADGMVEGQVAEVMALISVDLLSPIPSANVPFSTGAGDYGAIATSAVVAAAGNMTSEQKDLVGLFLRPGVLEVYRP